jgi:hypothetical protein
MDAIRNTVNMGAGAAGAFFGTNSGGGGRNKGVGGALDGHKSYWN